MRPGASAARPYRGMQMRRPIAKKATHPLQWVCEPLSEEASYFDKPMFGCRACYVHGKLVMVLASGEEPWNGVLVPTERSQHTSLCADFPGLSAHAVLGKWLYLSCANDEFEERSRAVVRAILDRDPRIGVEPGKRRRARSR